MNERTTYAVFFKAKATNYDPHPQWRQYNDWAESIEYAETFLRIAKKNARFEEIKIVKRTETFEDCEVQNDD